jgi:DNA-binding NarL/FixJ family response regulator
LIVSRAEKLFPHYKRRLTELGFKDVETTSEEKDSLNTVINEVKPRLVLIGSGFYHAGTPYMAGMILKNFPNLTTAAVSLGEFPDSLAAWFIWRGVKSYLNLWEGYEEFHNGLQEVRRGKAYISPGVRKMMDRSPEWPETKDKMQRRQMETLILLCCGFVPKDIGDAMHIDRRTVGRHLEELYKMFHVKNRGEMVAAAWGLGIVTEKDVCFYSRKREKTGPLPEWAAVKLKMERRVLRSGAFEGGKQTPPPAEEGR